MPVASAMKLRELLKRKLTISGTVSVILQILKYDCEIKVVGFYTSSIAVLQYTLIFLLPLYSINIIFGLYHLNSNFLIILEFIYSIMYGFYDINICSEPDL